VRMQQRWLRSRVCLIALVAAASATLPAQRVLTPEFERLRIYEGTYEAEGGGTL